MGSLKVQDLMTKDVVSLGPHDTLEEVYDLMDNKHFRHVPVVNEDGELMGLITQRDLLEGALGDVDELPVGLQREMLSQTKVEEVMTVEPETVEPTTPLLAAGQLLLEHKFGCLPVVDGTTLVGILTESDFVRQVVDLETD